MLIGNTDSHWSQVSFGLDDFSCTQMHRETIKHRQAHKTDEHMYTKRHTDMQTSIQKGRAQTHTHIDTHLYTPTHT